MSKQKLSVPIMVKSNRSGEWKEEFKDGPIGGFTFPDGEKSMIYQCGKCGTLTKFSKGYNKHNKEKHGVDENIVFGFAEEQNWQELDIKVEDIVK